MPTLADLINAFLDIISNTGVLVLAFFGVLIAATAYFISRLARGGR